MHAAYASYEKASSLRRLGATSAASSSGAPRAQGRLLSYSTRSEPRLFTLWQAMNLFGSTVTERKTFSSLTTLRGLLSAKRGSDYWMGILNSAQSKAGSSSLTTLLSLFAPTTQTTSRSRRLCDVDLTQEDSSISEDEEETIEISESSCSEEESDQDEEEALCTSHRKRARDAFSPRSSSKRTRRYFMDEEADE
jgi:hypothetical protein